MGIATFPASSGGLSSAIKSIQRGSAASAGNITISAVVVAKTICNSFSTGSAGSVAATGTINAANGTTSGASTNNFGSAGGGATPPGQSYTVQTGFRVINRYQTTPNFGFGLTGLIAAFNINAQNVGLNATSLTGGSTSLTSAVYGIHLVDSTTITATGPCRYEVIEYF